MRIYLHDKDGRITGEWGGSTPPRMHRRFFYSDEPLESLRFKRYIDGALVDMASSEISEIEGEISRQEMLEDIEHALNTNAQKFPDEILPLLTDGKRGEITAYKRALNELKHSSTAMPLPSPPIMKMTDRVNIERNRRLTLSYAASVTGYANTISINALDGSNLQAMSQRAQMQKSSGDTTTLARFRDNDNIDHEITPDQIIELGLSLMNHVEKIYEASWALKDSNPVPEDYISDTHWQNQ